MADVSTHVRREVQVPVAGTTLAGDLVVPPAAHGVVLFAHGSASSRHSPRNQHVAAALREAGYGTLLVDLVAPDEDQAGTRGPVVRFDVDGLARRVTGAADWLLTHEATAGLPLALVGASTGAAATRLTAAHRPEHVRAVVCRGGRPDLVGPSLAEVRAPTLLVVGGADELVLELNRQAAAALTSEHEVAVVPGASHLFPEPGALEQVADLTIAWLDRVLLAGAPSLSPWSAAGTGSSGRRGSAG